MWAWLTTLDGVGSLSLQSLPRELRLDSAGALRIKPLSELESLRTDPEKVVDLMVTPPEAAHGNEATAPIATLASEAYEIRIEVSREQAIRKRFGVQLFADADHAGLEVMIRPETGTLRVGDTDAPFAVAELPPQEDVEIRLFVDKYLVEVFVNERQAIVATYLEYEAARELLAYSYGDPTLFRSVEIWKMKATNQGFLEARDSRIWAPTV
jgi:beta-fructofuranosidase